MTMRITNKHLELKVEHLNKITNQPEASWTRTEGKSTANIGNYHLDYAYGGVTLHQMHNEGGAVTTPLGGGFYTKRELFYKLGSFIAGVELNK